MLSHSELLQLKRWNTPTVYNGWEQITQHNAARECFNLEETRDFMPQMGPMVGYAITLVLQPGEGKHRDNNPNALNEYLDYMSHAPGPKIVVVQDLDKPVCYGTAWGEVFSNGHRLFGCVGAIIDGGIRDLDEMTNAGFKAIARRLCVGHGKAFPVKWNCPVEVFGTRVNPGQLIHADKHGFLAVPPEDEERLLEAALFMDRNECSTVIPAVRNSSYLCVRDALRGIETAVDAFGKEMQGRYGRSSEWESMTTES